MRVVCAWCKRVIADGEPPDTHGICPACLREFLQRAGIKRPMVQDDAIIDDDHPCPHCGGTVGHRVNCPAGIASSDGE